MVLPIFPGSSFDYLRYKLTTVLTTVAITALRAFTTTCVTTARFTITSLTTFTFSHSSLLFPSIVPATVTH